MDEQYLIRDLKIPCVYHDSNFISNKVDANEYYETLRESIPWQKTNKINRWVRLYQAVDDDNDETNGDGANNQQQTAYTYKDAPPQDADNNKDNKDNKDNNNAVGLGYPDMVQSIREKCQEWYAAANPGCSKEDIPSLNVCLLNFYEDGQQRIGWHSDREEIGRTTPIVSVSLGASRQFLLRSQTDGRNDRCSITLTSGSVTVMEPICQIKYLHSVPKESNVLEGRINLTFRCKDFNKSSNSNSTSNSTADNNNNNNKQTTEGEELHERRDTFIDRITNGIEPSTAPWTASNSKSSTINSTCRAGDTDTAETRTGEFGSSKPYLFGEEEEEEEDENNILEPSNVQFLIKTNMGAERYCKAEINERLFTLSCDNYINMDSWTVITRPFDLDGYIAVVHKINIDNDNDNAGFEQVQNLSTITNNVRDTLLQLKTAHHVLKYHYHFHLKECKKFVHQYINININDTEDGTTNIDEMKVEQYPKETLYEHIKEQLINNIISFRSIENEDQNENDNENDNDNESTTKATTKSNTKTVTTFRVTSDRVGGPHAWQTPEVEYEIGGAIAEIYSGQQTSSKYNNNNWKPKMVDYDICIRADIIGKLCVIGTQLNIHDLSKGRHFQRFRNAVTIKTNLAYAMIRLANINSGDKILDPFCGSGTLLLEALDIYNGNLNNCLGMDVSRRSAIGSRENAEAEGYTEDTVKFVCSDARTLRRKVDADGTVNAIVTNLPWGIMTGQNQSVSSLQTLYEVFLRNSWYVLKPGGRVVMLVLRGLQIMRIVRKLSGRFRLLHINVIRTTNNLPCIIVIEKLNDDIVRDSIKGQLAHLNQYVNVSPEIYKSIHCEEVDEDCEPTSSMNTTK
jgi:tRNA G10  N-methylase Trm11/alkylated DNA repair dioxygenase AlkB